MKNLLQKLMGLIAAVLLTGNATWAQESDIPAGSYTIDPAHTSVLFRVNHLGFSMYTARFTKFNAQLQFDPGNLANSHLQAEVDARSLETDFPATEAFDFNQQLQGPDWLHTEEYPTMIYESTAVKVVGENTMEIEGVLTLKGVSKPVTFDATFNGGWAGIPQDPNARVGFSARAQINRADFNISVGILEPGSTIGVSDAVDIIIETEFIGPRWKQ